MVSEEPGLRLGAGLVGVPVEVGNAFAGSTSSHRNAFPGQWRLGLVIIAYAASAYSSGMRALAIASSPPSRFWTAAVAISVRGHSALEAMPSARNSAANPRAHRVIPAPTQTVTISSLSAMIMSTNGRTVGMPARAPPIIGRKSTRATHRLWVPKTVSPYVTWAYWWLRSASRSRCRTRHAVPSPKRGYIRGIRQV